MCGRLDPFGIAVRASSFYALFQLDIDVSSGQDVYKPVPSAGQFHRPGAYLQALLVGAVAHGKAAVFPIATVLYELTKGT